MIHYTLFVFLYLNTCRFQYKVPPAHFIKCSNTITIILITLQEDITVLYFVGRRVYWWGEGRDAWRVPDLRQHPVCHPRDHEVYPRLRPVVSHATPDRRCSPRHRYIYTPYIIIGKCLKETVQEYEPHNNNTCKYVFILVLIEAQFTLCCNCVTTSMHVGKPVIRSLKTRLLALQALGAIMVNLTDTSPEAQSKCSKVSWAVWGNNDTGCM